MEFIVISQYCWNNVVCIVSWCCYYVFVSCVFFINCQCVYVDLVDDIYWIVRDVIVGNQLMMQCYGMVWYIEWIRQYVFSVYFMFNIVMYYLLDMGKIGVNFCFVVQCQFVVYYQIRYRQVVVIIYFQQFIC